MIANYSHFEIGFALLFCMNIHERNLQSSPSLSFQPGTSSHCCADIGRCGRVSAASAMVVVVIAVAMVRSDLDNCVLCEHFWRATRICSCARATALCLYLRNEKSISSSSWHGWR